MKSYSFTGKILIGIIVAATLLVVGGKIFTADAAGRIDSEAKVYVTAAVANNDTSIFATKFKGVAEIKLYKIGQMDETGKLTLPEGLENSGIKLTTLEGSPTVDAVTADIVTPAKTAVANKEADAVITIDRGEAAESSKKVELTKGPGLYLYVPTDTEDKRYAYTFTSYVLLVPTSEYIITGSGSDEWVYEAEFNIKSQATEKFGDLEITKTLDTFNISLGPAAFVYRVTAVRDEATIFENVYAINFDGPGKQSRVIYDIPADAVVTVVEEYTGASYKVVGDASKEVTIVGGNTVTADFENTYDERLIVGGISAENVFVEEQGEVYWIGNNLPAETVR